MELSAIAIVNKSTRVTDAQGKQIVAALNSLLPTFCTNWNIVKCVASYVTKTGTTSVKSKITLMDSADPSLNLPTGVLGYHDINSSDNPFGTIIVNAVLSYGGTILSGNGLSVSQTICHEVFETLVDPTANRWWDDGISSFWAAEVCDAVEGNVVKVNVPAAQIVQTIATGKFIKQAASTVSVSMSDWILPAWSDHNSLRGPYNHNNTLTLPFTIDRNGYGIKASLGSMDTSFGEKVTSEQKIRYLAKRRVDGRLQKGLQLAGTSTI
jgi:hypothetical protein